MSKPLYFLYPGDLETRTGGYRYDRRIIESLPAKGWDVHAISLPDSFPFPDAADLQQTSSAIDRIPDQSNVVIDGLAFSAMPDVVKAHCNRLRITALIHHPLALETGLTQTQADALAEQERRALACVSNVITTSNSTSSELENYQVPAEIITAVLPGTDIGPVAKGSPNSTPKLICVATLTPRKAHMVLFKALQQLRELSWHLDCGGSMTLHPETTQALQAYISNHHLESRITLLGELDDAALSELYQKADVFVLASLHEGYGMVLTEAIAHGLPIVCTHAGAMRDTAPPDASILVEPNDVDALADALKIVLTDHAHRQQLAHQALLARQKLRSWDQAATEFARAVSP